MHLLTVVWPMLQRPLHWLLKRCLPSVYTVVHSTGQGRGGSYSSALEDIVELPRESGAMITVVREHCCVLSTEQCIGSHSEQTTLPLRGVWRWGRIDGDKGLWAILIAAMLSACGDYSHAVGDIVLNSDLPVEEVVLLPLGITLNHTAHSGVDLLSDNLLVNGSFELARLPEQCTYSTTTHELTTPNGFRTYYPIATQLHGWEASTGSSLTHATTSPIHQSSSGSALQDTGYVHMTQSSSDSIPQRLAQVVGALSPRTGEQYRIELYHRGVGVVLEAYLLDLQSGAIVSSIYRPQPSTEWTQGSAILQVTADADSVALCVVPRWNNTTGSAPHSLMVAEDSIAPIRRISAPLHGYMDVDRVRLTADTTPIATQLYQLLSQLPVRYVRYPAGRTTNGYYPGTYPVWSADSIVDIEASSFPLWNLEQGEVTGEYTPIDMVALSRHIGAMPIYLFNFGFTDPSAMQRIEDISLLPRRSEMLRSTIQSLQADSIALQLGYDLSSDEYERRFSSFAPQVADLPNVTLVAAGSLARNGRRFSDYVVDYALPPLTTPDLMTHIAEQYHIREEAPEPIMLGELRFAPAEHPYMPTFVLKAAALIEAERHSHLIRGVGLSPLIAEEIAYQPLLLKRNGLLQPTTFFHFYRSFGQQRGVLLRRLSDDQLRRFGIYSSLTSDKAGDHYYLKAANTTRHPITLRLHLRGNQMTVQHMHSLSYVPTASTTTYNRLQLEQYEQREERRRLYRWKSTEVTLSPFEVLIMELY